MTEYEGKDAEMITEGRNDAVLTPPPSPCWNRTDAGRGQSRRPRQSNDCTVRAVATVLDIDYDVAYDSLKACGRKCSEAFRFPMWIASSSLGKDRFSRIAFPAVKGMPRMTIAEFCRQHPEGRFICSVAKHVFAVIDGVVHDDRENRDDRCVYLAWKLALSSADQT